MPMRAGNMASVSFGIRDRGKTKAPARAILWALFFDVQGVGQEEQLCQMEKRRGFMGFLAGGFLWLASGPVASAGWILDRNSKIHPETWDAKCKHL